MPDGKGGGGMNHFIPKDDNMLFSYINTMLRDEYGSLEEFCIVTGYDMDEITESLRAAGFEYDEALNQFK